MSLWITRLPGLVFTLLIGLTGLGLAALPPFQHLQLSELTLAIVIGMLLGNA